MIQTSLRNLNHAPELPVAAGIDIGTATRRNKRRRKQAFAHRVEIFLVAVPRKAIKKILPRPRLRPKPPSPPVAVSRPQAKEPVTNRTRPTSAHTGWLGLCGGKSTSAHTG